MGGDRWRGHGKAWPENHRPCVSCGNMKNFSEFHAHKECKFGVNTVCKACRILISKQEWRDTMPEKKVWNRAKQRAKSRGIPFNIEMSDITIPEVCPVLGILLVVGDTEAAPSIDRVIPALGYVKGNVNIISNRANRIKSDATKEELERVLDYINCEIVDI